ncbi:MAG: energy transducer TonB [Vampirovibrionales bacterium]
MSFSCLTSWAAELTLLPEDRQCFEYLITHEHKTTPEVQSYLSKVSQLIRNNWKPGLSYKETLGVVVHFVIDRKGNTSKVYFVQASGSKNFDNLVALAIKTSEPLPVWEKQWDNDNFLTSEMNFDYKYVDLGLSRMFRKNKKHTITSPPRSVSHDLGPVPKPIDLDLLILNPTHPESKAFLSAYEPFYIKSVNRNFDFF